MNRAWSISTTPPRTWGGETDADAALAIVPYWHYVKDILVPQIQPKRCAEKGAERFAAVGWFHFSGRVHWRRSTGR